MHFALTFIASSVLAGHGLALTVTVPKQLSSDAPQGFRANAPRREPKSLSPRAEGAVEGSYDGGGWTLPVLIGGEQLILNIDTGSSDMYVHAVLVRFQLLTAFSDGLQAPLCQWINKKQ